MHLHIELTYIYTVKPEFKDHPRESQNMGSKHMWYLNTGKMYMAYTTVSVVIEKSSL